MKLNWILAVFFPAILQVCLIYGLLMLTFQNELWIQVGTIILAIPCLFMCIPTNHELARHFLGRPGRAAAYGVANIIIMPVAILFGFWFLGQMLIGLEYYF